MAQNNPYKDAAAFFQGMRDSTFNKINVAQIATVVDVIGNEVDVQPLGKINNTLPAKIIGARYLAGLELEKGDDVLIIFLDGDADNYDGGAYQVETNRMHNINDAVVVGRLS